MERATRKAATRNWADAERLLRSANCPERLIRKQRLKHERRVLVDLRHRVEDDLRKRGIY